MDKIISFDMEGDFGFFRKPDTNDGIQLSYNLIHKPSLLGIFGAILGLDGYRKFGEWPEYYRKLKHLQIGLAPLSNHERGNFDKTVITYTNRVGYANEDGPLIVNESTLVRPSYRIYVSLDMSQSIESELFDRLRAGEAVYLPYFGKNEHPLWWDRDMVREYAFEPFVPDTKFTVSSVVLKNRQAIAGQRAQVAFWIPDLTTESYAYFESLPAAFDERLYQYEIAEFAYTSWPLGDTSDLEGLYQLKADADTLIIQLF